MSDAAQGPVNPDVQSVMSVIEELGESLIQNGVDADAVVRGTLLAAMFLGSPLADYDRLPQWLRETADGLDSKAD
jgi:gluconate kinase